MLTRRALVLSFVALATSARAQSVVYTLDDSASRVGFTYRIGDTAHTGEMPVTRAEVRVNPKNLADSQVDVVLNPAAARTGFFIATQAIKGQSMLYTDAFPDIRFTSKTVQLAPSGRLSDGATVTGDLTVRDITRAITLDAALYRAPGSDPDDLSVLQIALSGTVSRSAFGASGYADIVGDAVDLDVLATIRRAV